ncbi:MAG: YdjY domain-containing protein [Candidatus Bathyarchaeota archaeon]|nr:YdjY domain-containing protein [Candidatus Termiticorpusculum sp.]
MTKVFVKILAALIIGLLIGFTGAYLYQQQTINKLSESLNGQPLSVQNGEIHLKATINNGAFASASFHGIAYELGKNGEVALFKTKATPKQFYDALTSLGALPGNNVKMDSDNTTYVQGTGLDVYVTWDGAPQRYTLQEVLNGCIVDIKFGGNLETSNSMGTGCITCLGSCAVGISSNAAYAAKTSPQFTANSDILPPVGTEITVIYSLKA